MSEDVQFDEDNYKYGKPQSQGGFPGQSSSPDQAGMVGWLMKKGIAKSAKSAEVILIIFMIIDFVIAYALYKFFT